MLVHLSNTSPYLCDLNRGPIEQANRMASAPTKKATALLEQKESFPKQTRTPLKLLAPGEVPMDSTITTTDFNASLQPVWYTEQTIVDEHHVQPEDIASIIQEQQGKSSLLRTTLPPIQSESPSIMEEEIPSQPLLMHKSSTFTIEPTINVDSSLNDSEKENVIKEDTTNQIIPPSDDSFRALEHLLGLGSTPTSQESPKTNHDTLSLTVVTPTDIINATTTSLRMSYAPKGSSGGSLPSSQEIPIMPTIESITSTNPPSFLMDNTAMEEEQPSTNQQTSFDITDNDTIKDDANADDETNFSFELNDFPNNSENISTDNIPAPPPPMINIRAPTCADVAYRALIKPRLGGGRVSQPVKADSPLAKSGKLRSSAPTSRTLRSSCRRISTDYPSQNSIAQDQPSLNTECFVNETETNSDPLVELVEILTVPEEDENEQEKTTSVTLNLSSPKPIKEINPNVSEKISTPTKPLVPLLSREYTYNTPKRRSSQRRRSMLNNSTINEEKSNSPAIASKSMLGILLTNQPENEATVLQETLTPSPVRTSTRQTNSLSIASKSMLGVLLTNPTENEKTQTTSIAPSSARTSTRQANSPSIASKSMLGVLLTNPTENEPSVLQETLTPSPVRTSTRQTNSPSIASKSMLGVLLTNPTENEKTLTTSIAPSPVRTSIRQTNSPSIASKSLLGILLTTQTDGETSALRKTLSTSIAPSPTRNSTRKSERIPTNLTPRVSINPLHSSTPSSLRHKSLQMVSIGEQEQVLTTVPQSINADIQEEEDQQQIEMVPLNDTEESIQQPSRIEIGIQTTPSLNVSSRRRLNTSGQQSTPIVQMNKSIDEQQITPLQSKVIVNLQRNVRFQLTPSTDARLVAKEKVEDNFRGLKPDVVIHSIPIISEPIQQNVKSVATKKITKSKKKQVAPKKPTEPKRQPITKKSRQARKAKPEVAPPKTRVQRKPRTVEITPPTKRAPARKQPTIEVSPPTKRAPRKRTIPEATVEPVAKRAKTAKSTEAKKQTVEGHPRGRSAKTKTIASKPIAKRARAPKSNEVKKQPVEVRPRVDSANNKTSDSEPIAKRARTSKSIEVPQRGRSATNKTNISEPIAKRARATKSIEVKKQSVEVTIPKTRSGSTNNKTSIPEPIAKRARASKSDEVLPPKTRSGLTNNKKNISEPVEQQPKIETEVKNATSATKASKRRLTSVEKKEENIQSIPLIQNQEERQKIEALTVAGLKSRLNAHKEDIPKGAKKADLIALLIKIETNLPKEQKEVAPSTVRTTRRRKT